MNSLSTEAKIGIAIAIVALAAVLWLRTGTREEVPPMPPAAGQARRRDPRSARVQERLAELREGRAPADSHPAMAGDRIKRLRDRTLPTPAFGGEDEGGGAANAPLPPDTQNIDLDDLDFESLSQQALHDGDPDNRIAALWMISMFDDDPVVDVLTNALSDPDPEVRLAAVQSLSEFSDDEPIEALTIAMNDTDPEVRFEALGVIAEMGGEKVQPLLAKALDDTDEDVRSLAEGIADMDDSFSPPPTAAGAPTP